MLTILSYVQQAIAIIIALVMLVERQGDGQAKRQEVIDGVQLALAALPIPAWIKTLFTLDAVIGVFVDVAVALLNKLSIFQKDAVVG